MSLRESERLRSSSIVRFGLRARILTQHRRSAAQRPYDALHYLLKSRELSNFTYELRNIDSLAGCVATALDVQHRDVLAFITELADDLSLRTELASLLRMNPRRDDVPRYGYRFIYYAATRIAKPRVIVEIGTHDGLGAAVLSRALERNSLEGDAGHLYSIDTGERAGWLIPPRLRERCTLARGDAMAVVPDLLRAHGCGLLIDDIGFAYPAKRALFETALALVERPVIIGSEFPRRTTQSPPTRLAELAHAQSGRYAEFNEEPLNHFWPGHTQALAQFS